VIGRADISALVISEKKTTVWELADMLASRQSKKAQEFLDRLLRDGEAPLEMLGAITWMYRKVMEASELKGVINGWQAARPSACAQNKRKWQFRARGRFRKRVCWEDCARCRRRTTASKAAKMRAQCWSSWFRS